MSTDICTAIRERMEATGVDLQDLSPGEWCCFLRGQVVMTSIKRGVNSETGLWPPNATTEDFSKWVAEVDL